VIVRCVQIISPVTGEVVSDHPSIRIGAEYPVLEVLAGKDRMLFRLPDQDAYPDEYESPALWAADMFVVVSERIPGCWTAELTDGVLTLAPREWQRIGFWDDYFNDVPAAVAAYDRLKAEILAESI
jgi:hypothetical protein